MKWMLLLLLVGCDEWTSPYHKCLHNESYTYTTTMMVGKIFIPQVRRGTRCTSYSNDWYIANQDEIFRLVKE